MRDIKLQVETHWNSVGEWWTITVYMVVAPSARYTVAYWTTTESDPMFSVVEKFQWLFNPVFDVE